MGSWQPRCQGFGANQQKVQPAQLPQQFFPGFFLGLAAYFTSEAKASSRFSSCPEPQHVPDNDYNDSSGKAGFPPATGHRYQALWVV